MLGSIVNHQVEHIFQVEQNSPKNITENSHTQIARDIYETARMKVFLRILKHNNMKL